MSLLDLHPVARATSRRRGHHLHIGRSAEGIGYVAKCSCHQWGRWFADRRIAVLAFRQTHLGITARRAA